MAKEKTELEKAGERLQALVSETNLRINELGAHTSCLYQSLCTIQNQFDKIRNIPSETQLEYNKLKEIRIGWKNQVECIEDDYQKAQNVNIGGGAAGASLGVGVATLGPTAAMGIATTLGVASTGTAISALSGAAATNAALAWLGGGALAAGGGGMAAGHALLALAGPIGWALAGVALIGSGLLFWKMKSDKEKLTNLFLLISERDQKKYQLAIVELKERISRIITETGKLTEAIGVIGAMGLDFNAMSPEQKMLLGSYVNLMKASTQLLVNPILGLLPNVVEPDYYNASLSYYASKVKDFILYVAGLLYGVSFDSDDFKLLVNSFKKNKEFLESMHLEKDDIDSDLYEAVVSVIHCARNRR